MLSFCLLQSLAPEIHFAAPKQSQSSPMATENNQVTIANSNNKVIIPNTQEPTKPLAQSITHKTHLYQLSLIETSNGSHSNWL